MKIDPNRGGKEGDWCCSTTEHQERITKRSGQKNQKKNSEYFFGKFQRTNTKLAKERNCPNSVDELVTH